MTCVIVGDMKGGRGRRNKLLGRNTARQCIPDARKGGGPPCRQRRIAMRSTADRLAAALLGFCVGRLADLEDFALAAEDVLAALSLV